MVIIQEKKVKRTWLLAQFMHPHHHCLQIQPALPHCDINIIYNARGTIPSQSPRDWLYILTWYSIRRSPARCFFVPNVLALCLLPSRLRLHLTARYCCCTHQSNVDRLRKRAMTMIMIENNYYIIFLFCDNFIYVRARHFPTKKFLAHFRTWAFNFLIFRAHGPTQRRSLVTFPYYGVVTSLHLTHHPYPPLSHSNLHTNLLNSETL